MKTIKQFIADTCSFRRARMETDCNDRILETYAKYPELEHIDSIILKVRRTNLIKVIEMQMEPSMIVSDEERQLIAKRKDFLAKYGIDESFDEIRPECPKCKDTGFIKQKSLMVVCSCMSNELIEAYNEAGLSDYNSIVPKNFKADYIPSAAERRKEANKTLVRILNSITEGKSHPLYVYSDGAQKGKTYLAVVVTKIAITLGLSAAYVKCEDLTDIYDDKLESYKSFDLVIIDDYISGATRIRNLASVLNAIIETRNSRGLATVIVSNETKLEMVEKSDERIAGKISRAIDI